MAGAATIDRSRLSAAPEVGGRSMRARRGSVIASPNDLEPRRLFEVRGPVQVFGGPNAVGDAVLQAVLQAVRTDTVGVVD
jgi:hypothetical protein